MGQTLLGIGTILAVIVAPIAALGIQRWAENRREARKGKLWVYKTLMMYRATPLAYSYVQALNLIDVEFSSDRPEDKAVRDAWNTLLDHFTNNKGTPDFLERSLELTSELLARIGKCLGFEFSQVYLKRHAYLPEAHGKIEDEQHSIRRLTLDVLNGNRRIPIAVFPDEFPPLNITGRA